MSTPPPGWAQQQQQPPPGYGYPPPGYGHQQHPPPPPPGYGYPPQRPAKKSKAPLVIALVVGLLALGGVGAGAYFYLNAHRDQGTAATGAKLPGQCGGVTGQTLERLRTTNPNGRSSNQIISDSHTFTACSWQQTKGRDGEGHRSLSARVDEFREDGGKSAQEQAEQQYGLFESEVQSGAQFSKGPLTVESLGGVGDRALVAVQLDDSAFTDVTVVVLKGGVAVTVNYTGWDIGVFSPVQPDLGEFKALARGAAEELVGKL